MTQRIQLHWQLDVYQLSVEAAMEIYALSILRTVRNCVLCRSDLQVATLVRGNSDSRPNGAT